MPQGGGTAVQYLIQENRELKEKIDGLSVRAIQDASAAGDYMKVIKEKWNTLPDGTYLINIYCGLVYSGVVQRIENGKYGSVLVFGYSGNAYLVYKSIENWNSKTL